MPDRSRQPASARRSPRRVGSRSSARPPIRDPSNAVAAPPQRSHAPQSRVPQTGGAATDLVIKRIMLDGPRGTALIVNRGPTPLELSDWHLCQASHAFPLAVAVLDPGRQLRVHLIAGQDTPHDRYAAGRLGEFADDGELALYRDGPIGLPSAMAAYVAWGAGGPAQPIAQAARFWGDTNVDAAQGDIIVLTGPPTGALSYLVHRPNRPPADRPQAGAGTRASAALPASEGWAPW